MRYRFLFHLTYPVFVQDFVVHTNCSQLIFSLVPKDPSSSVGFSKCQVVSKVLKLVQ